MAFLGSPRLRRRAAWLAAAVAATAGAVALLVTLLPGHGGRSGKRAAPTVGVATGAPTTSSLPLGPGPSAATERARAQAVAVVEPLATAFVRDLTRRHDLAGAHALLDGTLRTRYPLGDWQQGRHLPLSLEH